MARSMSTCSYAKFISACVNGGFMKPKSGDVL